MRNEEIICDLCGEYIGERKVISEDTGVYYTICPSCWAKIKEKEQKERWE